MSGRGCRTTLRIFGTGGQGTYAVRCTASRGRLQSRSRVKSGNSHVAPILSGLHLSADVGRRAARLRSRAPATAGIGGGDHRVRAATMPASTGHGRTARADKGTLPEWRAVRRG
jgi:hypothetical protein